MIVVVPSCAHYDDVLTAFFHCFDRFWPDCPFARYVLNGRCTAEGWVSVNTAPDLGWAESLVRFITEFRIRENLLLLFDDCILLSPIDTSALRHLDGQLSSDVASIRLSPYAVDDNHAGFGWSGSAVFSNSDKRGAFYATREVAQRVVSLRPAIWNSRFIVKHFDPRWSPWQQEMLGTEELREFETLNGFACEHRFLAMVAIHLFYLNAVQDGKYSPEFIEFVARTVDLRPFPWRRDVARPRDLLGRSELHRLYRRQRDGYYPSPRYVGPELMDHVE
jgi:hypothetical protein